MEIPYELSTCSDAELLRLAVAGEEQAFLLLYGRLKAGIFRYAFYMTNSKVNAEEVVQEVFITLLKESHNYRQDRGDLAAFSFGIARNFVRRNRAPRVALRGAPRRYRPRDIVEQAHFRIGGAARADDPH
jgi:DNA-directed RNA polymerase specialized sigma24 family protein